MNYLMVILAFLPFYFRGIVAHYPVPNGTPISQQFGNFPDGADMPHVGVDFKLDSGTPVYADMAGTIIMALDDSRVYGRSIMIKHDIDGYTALYGHLSKLLVHKSDHVYPGEVIGLSGGIPGTSGAGWSSGAHLHYEIRQLDHLSNNKYNVDPLQYLQRYIDMNIFPDEYKPS